MGVDNQTQYGTVNIKYCKFENSERFAMLSEIVGVQSLVLITAVSVVLAKIPTDYILQVKHDCGEDAVADAHVSIVTDLDAKAKAVCAGSIVDFDFVNQATLGLPVSYPGHGSSQCIFHQKAGSRVFVVTVIVSFGEPDNPVHQEEEEYTLTCTFDAKGTEISGSQRIHDQVIAPVELKQHVGHPATNTSFHLFLTNVLGENYMGPVLIGRVVQLKATASGEASETGVRPTSCDAVSASAGYRYSILRAGCGDGLVFSKDEGFITDGLVAWSPMFEAFSLAGDTSLKFECNFTVCTTDCNGSTCLWNDRRRRREASSYTDSVNEDSTTLSMESQIVKVFRTRKRRSLSQKILDRIVKGLKN